MQDPRGDDSVASDLERTARTAQHLLAVAKAGWRLVITHGNGPQVGNHLFRSELAHEDGMPLLPLDVCVADTQGGMGYVLQQCLANAFLAADMPAVVATVVTQVLVDDDDPAFEHPSKPIGEVIADDRVQALKDRGWILVEDERKGGWRRVVPSPDPKEIIEADAISALVDKGVVVVAAGGGGIPVRHSADGSLEGIAAVVDKDLASSLLASDLGADGFLILTDVEEVIAGYGTDDERALASISVSEARTRLDAGEFPVGSMGPKVEALTRFVTTTGKLAVVTSIERAEQALQGSAGTRVVPG
ncbi:MAG: carbamate kinase [Actinomycetota bacterium]|nr:carbamate kinase [Actinomycetota bacterium]